MRLATIRHGERTYAARIDRVGATLLEYADVGALLSSGNHWKVAAKADGAQLPVESLRYAPVIPVPSKIFCVGLNYHKHIQEMGHDLPAYPTLFAKFAGSLIGASDAIRLPRVSQKVDWEVEMVIVIGATIRYGEVATSRDAIAGFAVGNDVSMRDFQNRTSQFLQGKTFESSTPLGPWLVTADEVGSCPDLEIRCEVDGTVRQQSRTSDLLYSPEELVAYASQIITLLPGDLIFTGTPEGVGQGRKPPIYLGPGQTVSSIIEGIGEMHNLCVSDA